MTGVQISGVSVLICTRTRSQEKLFSLPFREKQDSVSTPPITI